MYIQQLGDEFQIYLILYVDDMLIVRSDKVEIGKLKQQLLETCSMKELREDRLLFVGQKYKYIM